MREILRRCYWLARYGLMRLRWGDRITVARECRILRGALLRPATGSISIGRATKIEHGAILDANKGHIRLGERCSVNPYTILYGATGGLVIGNDVRIATHVVIIPENHAFDRLDIPIRKQGCKSTGIVIEDNVWIGAHCTILDGARIASGCVIAAGSVVRGHTEPNGVYAGVPARLVKSRSSEI